MATLVGVNPDPALLRVWARPLIAFAISLLAHMAVLLGVPVNPTGGTPFVTSTLYARLEPAASAVPAEALAEPQPPADPIAAQPDKSASVDPRADPAAKRPDPRPESKPAADLPPSSPSSGVEVPLIRDPTYYPARQLDAYPQPLTAIQLQYPDHAIADRVDGRLLMLLLIDEFGVVTEVSVVEAEPPGYFEEAARSVFRIARFAPGMKQGRAVKSRVLVQVRYTYGEKEGSVR